MSAETVDVARRMFDRASRVKDPSGRRIDALDDATIAAVFDSFDSDVVLHEDPSFPEGGTYRGTEAVAGYFSQFSESFDEFSFEAEDFLDLGEDRVLILFHIRTRGKGSGAVTEAKPGWIYTFRGEKVVGIEAYFDRNDAFAAAGLGDTASGASG